MNNHTHHLTPSIPTYYPDLPDFSKYNIRTEKGYSSDSEIVNLDT